jgi:hypothetical protein
MLAQNDNTVSQDADPWPALPLAAWADTYATLHMWTQIVGKIRLKLSPRPTIGGRYLCTSPRAA